MDLLTVALHELGHVLGLDPDAGGEGVMAQTLAPGVRRVPTRDDLPPAAAGASPGAAALPALVPSPRGRALGAPRAVPAVPPPPSAVAPVAVVPGRLTGQDP